MSNVLLSKILPNPEQPRRSFDPAGIQQLAQSIKRDGLLVPITVEGPYERITGSGEVDEYFILIAGERRVRACKLLGWQAIEAHVLALNSTSGADRLRMALVENVQREQMNAIDTARAYHRLHVDYGLSVAQIAEDAGKSLATVYNYLYALELDEEILEIFRAGALSLTREVIQALLSLPSAQRIAAAKSLAAQGATAKMVIAACKRLAAANEARPLEEEPEIDEPIPALRLAYSKRKPPARPEWNAIAQLRRLPTWPLLVEATRETCDQWCTVRDMAGDTICRECPLVEAVRRMMKKAEGQ